MPFMRIYVINAADLIPAVQRHYRILDFAPLAARSAINVMGASPAGKKILIRNSNGKDDFSYAILFTKAIHPAVSPGAALDAMSLAAVKNVVTVVDRLACQAPRRIKLYAWMEKEITRVTTDAVYGTENPFRDEKIHEAYWYIFLPQSCNPLTHPHI